MSPFSNEINYIPTKQSNAQYWPIISRAGSFFLFAVGRHDE